MGTSGGDSAVAVRDRPEAVPELSPQQLQLVQQHFGKVCVQPCLQSSLRPCLPPGSAKFVCPGNAHQEM